MLREKDMDVLLSARDDKEGTLFRNETIDAFKRAGAKVKLDSKKRLTAYFGSSALYMGLVKLI